MDQSSHSSSELGGFPALLPPPGVSSGSTHPNSIGPRVTVASIICLTLMTLSVIVRFYTKLFIKHVWGWDDCEYIFFIAGPNKLMASRFLYTCNGKERCQLLFVLTLLKRTRLEQSVSQRRLYQVRSWTLAIIVPNQCDPSGSWRSWATSVERPDLCLHSRSFSSKIPIYFSWLSKALEI